LATPSPNICICTLEAQADVIEVGMFTTKEGEGVVVEQLPAPRVGKMTFKLPLLSVPVIISASRLLNMNWGLNSGPYTWETGAHHSQMPLYVLVNFQIGSSAFCLGPALK
jgi:hypothetical protein